jgi:hypothetical protein
MSLLEDIKNEENKVSLLEELNNAPEATQEYTESEQWRPEPGEGIEGVITEVYSFTGKFVDAKTGDFPTIPGWVLKVEGDDTLWSVAGLHGVLRGEMEKAEAQIGDRVAVLYSGKRESKGGTEYNHYRVAIRRGNGAPVPAQAAAPARETNGLKPAGSTQHEPVAAKPARRKPGQAKADGDDTPPF